MNDKPTILCGGDGFLCPLFLIDLEDCNLGYNTQFKQIGDKGYHVSSDCRLLEIETADKTIRPPLFKLEGEPPCDHEFFKCQVPAGDSCVAIYRDVCRKCHWDATKGIFMPPNIWRGWAVPQLEELDSKWDATKAGSMSLDWREWTTPPIERLDNERKAR